MTKRKGKTVFLVILHTRGKPSQLVRAFTKCAEAEFKRYCIVLYARRRAKYVAKYLKQGRRRVDAGRITEKQYRRDYVNREKRPSEPYEKEVLNWRYIHPAFPFYSFDSVEVVEVPVDAAPQTERG